MVKQYIVSLSETARQYLEPIVTTGKRAAYTINHARIRLKADRNQAEGDWTDQAIQAARDISLRPLERVRQRFVEDGLDAVLKCRPGGGRKPKLTGAVEAHLVALRCGAAPGGKGRWPLRLLADQRVELGDVEQLSHERVRQVLKKTNCHRGDNSAG